jgi:DNA-binding PucR family transcriptional regulator
MSDNVYDLAQLTESNGIDRSLVKLFFFENKDYFDALTLFKETFHRRLAHFTPAFVVFSPDDRALFLAECLKVRTVLMQLGLTIALRELDAMENAVHTGCVKEFSDGQIKFDAAVEIYMQVIEGALLY